MQRAVPNTVARATSVAESPPGHKFRQYFSGWNQGFCLGPEGKREGLADCCALSQATATLLKQLRARQELLAGLAGDTLVESVTFTSPIATGLGLEHPVENGFAFADPYGVPYLPGSSVKGALRSAAEALAVAGDEGWSLPAVWWLFGFDEKSAWHAPKDNRARQAFMRALGGTERETLRAFSHLLDGEERRRFEADPVGWLGDATGGRLPRVRGALVPWDVYPAIRGMDVEIMTPHHSDYLQAERPAAPLDSEEPNPIGFLVVPRGTTATFILAFEPVELTPGWVRERWRGLLQAAFKRCFERRGFGAKTVLGFGTGGTPSTARRVRFVSPAFVGGADHRRSEHTTLRAATLRGHLRWWWRTTQVGFLTTEELRAVEDALWGSVRTSKSPITVRVAPGGSNGPAQLAPYVRDGERQLVPDEAFLSQHGIASGKGVLPLRYAAYGMADGNKRRHVLHPGAEFQVDLDVNGPGRFDTKGPFGRLGELSESSVRAQLDAAWALLCACGAVGAKSRHGFGSLCEVGAGVARPQEAIEFAKAAGKRLRDVLGLASRTYDERRAAGAYSLDALAAAPVVIPLRGEDAWWAMNAVGAAMMKVATEWKHLARKTALGLPRKIHGPTDTPLRHQNAESHEPPRSLSGSPPVEDRHASPVHLSRRRGQRNPGGEDRALRGGPLARPGAQPSHARRVRSAPRQ